MQNLAQKQVRCPYCQAGLNIKNSKDERERMIACPICKQAFKVSFVPKPGMPQQQVLEAKTAMVAPAPMPKPPVDAATQFVTPPTAGSGKTPPPVPMNARLIVNGKVYQLKERNTIGRRANSGSASVQIDTLDMYMSRNHISIDIFTLPDGTFKPVLKLTAAKNQTIVKGRRVNPGEVLILQNGDRIVMGNTEAVFMM